MGRHRYIRDTGILNTDKNRFCFNIMIKADTDCLEWKGSIKQNGYGMFKTLSRKVFHAHRYSYEFFVGEIPEGLCVLHSCDNRKCVNPEHLSVGTKKENTQDMYKKKRNPIIVQKGIRNSNAKLNEEDVLKIRKLYSDGLNCTQLSKIYDITIGAIDRIVRYKSWSHLIGDDADDFIAMSAKKKGELQRGRHRITSHLTHENIREIRKMVSDGYSQDSTAKKFLISQCTVSKIVHFKSYNEVT